MSALLNSLEILRFIAAAFTAAGGGMLMFLVIISDRSPDPWLSARPIFAAARWVWTPMALITVIAGAALAYYTPQGGPKIWAVIEEGAWIFGAGALGAAFHLAIRAAREGRPPASVVAGRRHRGRRNWMLWIGGGLISFAFILLAVSLSL